MSDAVKRLWSDIIDRVLNGMTPDEVADELEAEGMDGPYREYVGELRAMGDVWRNPSEVRLAEQERMEF